MDPKSGALLGPEALRQIQKLIRNEMLVARRTPRRGGLENAQASGIYVAKTPSGGIPAMADGVAGSAVCTVQAFDADDEVVDATNSSGERATIRVVNISAGDVAGETIIQAKQELATGRIVCDFEKC